ncbi:MAG TPA: DUF1990 domain-containing protein [Pyrinomonadaceae bacterium]|nr:DUF1990 domain-containing protein [Pyrinomonadaceae bacterium]
MFLLKRPTEKRIADFLRSTETLPFSYTEAGMTAVQPPAGYRVDHNRVILGKGPETFERAATLLKHWKHFDLGWVKLFPRDAPVALGSTVAVLVNHLFLWSLNSCRIIYVIDETEGPNRRFGFAYGTTIQHAESGEERFTIEWNASDDSVCYDILAYSRPQHWLARTGYPVTRWWQKRFSRDSLEAIQRHVSAEKG